MPHTFQCIPAARMIALASRADHRNDLPTDSDNAISKPQQHDCLLFGMAMCEILAKVDCNLDLVELETIINVAKQYANFVEYDMFAEPSGIVDTKRLLANQQKQLFFMRFANLIAAELNGELDAVAPPPAIAVF